MRTGHSAGRWWIVCLVLAALGGACLVDAVHASEPSAAEEAELSARDRRILRNWSVYWSFLVWPAGSAISVCFLDRDAEVRQLFASATDDWTRIANIRFDMGVPPGYRTCDPFEPSDIRVHFRAGSSGSILSGSSYVGTTSLNARPGNRRFSSRCSPRRASPGDPMRNCAGPSSTKSGTRWACRMSTSIPAVPVPPTTAGKRPARGIRRGRPRMRRHSTPAASRASFGRSSCRGRSRCRPACRPTTCSRSCTTDFPTRLLTNGRNSGCFTDGPRTLSESDAARMKILYPADAAAQAVFLKAQADIFRQTLAGSGLSRATAMRLAGFVEDQLRKRHEGLGIKIDVAGLDLPERDTTELEKALAAPKIMDLPEECRPAAKSAE